MKDMIKKQEVKELRIASVKVADLAKQEIVDAICKEAVEAQKMEAEAKKRYTDVKDNAKRLFSEKFGAGVKAVMYSPDNEVKIERTIKGGGVDISQEAFLKALYEYYDEPYLSKDGKAWEAFKAVSIPVECPRTISPELFDTVFKKEQKIEAGAVKTASHIPLDVFKSALVQTPISEAVAAKSMTKAEIKDAQGGDFETVVSL